MPSAQVYLAILTVCGSFLFSNGKFVKVPAKDIELHAVLKSSFELKCEYSGLNNPVAFLEWYKDDIAVSTEKQGHYQVRHSSKESKLFIQIFVMPDAEVKKWYVTVKMPDSEEKKACEFEQIKLIPSPQAITTNRQAEILTGKSESIRRVEGEFVQLKCVIKPELAADSNPSPVKWLYSQDEEQYSSISVSGVEVTGDQLIIDNVAKSHRGFYRCILNEIPFTIQLRVKDRLAALWPFLGIVGIVLVLVIIILVFEKRQKSAQKPLTTDDDDHDHANDPLVRSTNKTSENESKKRNVKA